MIRLHRFIPAHVDTVEFLWIKRDFMDMSDSYREIRSKIHRPADKCHFCGYHFANGDMMGLGAIKGQGNKIVCQKCIELIELDNHIECLESGKFRVYDEASLELCIEDTLDKARDSLRHYIKELG